MWPLGASSTPPATCVRLMFYVYPCSIRILGLTRSSHVLCVSPWVNPEIRINSHPSPPWNESTRAISLIVITSTSYTFEPSG